MTLQSKKHSIPVFNYDTDKNIFIVFDAKNESKTATGHTIEEAIAHLKQLN